MPVVMLLQLGAPTLCLCKRTPQSHLLYVRCCTYLVDCFINECVRRWLWGIHLLQRLRVPPGFPRFPRMPVVMLLQLGAPTLCLRKRTPQSHLLYAGNSLCLIASYGVAASKPGFRNNLLVRATAYQHTVTGYQQNPPSPCGSRALVPGRTRSGLRLLPSRILIFHQARP